MTSLLRSTINSGLCLQRAAPPERKLVTVEIVALEPNPGHLRHDSGSRVSSFSAAAVRTEKKGRGALLGGGASGGGGGSPKLAEVLLTVAPWADGGMQSVRNLLSTDTRQSCRMHLAFRHFTVCRPRDSQLFAASLQHVSPGKGE